MEPGRSNLFREIHKNSWLKRINPDHKKLPATKRSEKYFVVFCVHDDFEALLEGYMEPRFAPSHQPEWTVSLQTAQHISHALVPTENDYEFVVTMTNNVVRFTAPSWDVMQEWVSTLRSKLREMKIISPKENLYSRLPELRPALLPTRDPMSPLPPPPPVPAAIVPGIEALPATAASGSAALSSATSSHQTPSQEASANNLQSTEAVRTNAADNQILPSTSSSAAVAHCPAMSNTLTQNLLNMLSDPIVNLTNRLAAQGDDPEGSPQLSFLDRPSTSTTDANHNHLAEGQMHHIESDSDTSTISSSASSSKVSSLARTFTNNVLNDTQQKSAKPGSSKKAPLNREESAGSTSSSESSFKSLGDITPLVIPRPQTVKQQQQKRAAEEVNLAGKIPAKDGGESVDDSQATTNITIIQVSDPTVSNTVEASSAPPAVEDKTFSANIEVNGRTAASQSITQQDATTVKVTSPKLAAATTTTSNGYGEICNSETGVTNISVGAILIQATTTTSPSGQAQQPPVSPSQSLAAPATTTYEQVFIGDRNNNNNSNHSPIVSVATPLNQQQQPVQPPTPYSVFLLSRQQRSVSHVELTTPQRNRVQVNGSSQHVPPQSTNTQLNNKHSSPNNNISVEENRISNASSDAGQRKSEAQISDQAAPSGTRTRPAATQTSRNGESHQPAAAAAQRSSRQKRALVDQEARKRSSSTSGDHRNSGGGGGGGPPSLLSVHPRIVSPPRLPNGRPGMPSEAVNLQQRSGRISLREQQVVQLRREMLHPGGVRLQLRRKDCVGSIAWVDVFNSVWVAGWKQKDHPMLYNALHIGDRLVSVAGVAVSSGAEVNKLMRTSQSAFVELIVRRVPFGRVYAIRREMDGQCLGLIRDSNTATIVDIIPNGLAARHGLPMKASTCDGLSLTFWTLTEINGRPLNLFFKDNEIQDRLNAVGRDISILVQPLDLVAKLKKQLKAMRGYKDFIVQ